MFDKDDFAPLTTRDGPQIGKSRENRLVDNAGGNNTIATRIRKNPDGSTSMLRTRGGFPEVTTSTPAAAIAPKSTPAIPYGFVGEELPSVDVFPFRGTVVHKLSGVSGSMSMAVVPMAAYLGTDGTNEWQKYHRNVRWASGAAPTTSFVDFASSQRDMGWMMRLADATTKLYPLYLGSTPTPAQEAGVNAVIEAGALATIPTTNGPKPAVCSTGPNMDIATWGYILDSTVPPLTQAIGLDAYTKQPPLVFSSSTGDVVYYVGASLYSGTTAIGPRGVYAHNRLTGAVDTLKEFQFYSAARSSSAYSYSASHFVPDTFQGDRSEESFLEFALCACEDSSGGLFLLTVETGGMSTTQASKTATSTSAAGSMTILANGQPILSRQMNEQSSEVGATVTVSGEYCSVGALAYPEQGACAVVVATYRHVGTLTLEVYIVDAKKGHFVKGGEIAAAWPPYAKWFLGIGAWSFPSVAGRDPNDGSLPGVFWRDPTTNAASLRYSSTIDQSCATQHVLIRKGDGEDSPTPVPVVASAVYGTGHRPTTLYSGPDGAISADDAAIVVSVRHPLDPSVHINLVMDRRTGAVSTFDFGCAYQNIYKALEVLP